MQASLASLLNIKPIVALKDGILDVHEKVRTRDKSVRTVLRMVKDRLGDRRSHVAVVHARDPEAGRALLERVPSVLNCDTLIMTELSIGVAANLGPGTTGIVAYPLA